MDDEQQSQTSATVAQAAGMSGCSHPEAVGQRWGDPISEERQAELQSYIGRWESRRLFGRVAPGADDAELKSPFDGVRLTGADIYWLAELTGRGPNGQVPNLHLEGAILQGVHLERAVLNGAHLEQVSLQFGTHLEKASLHGMHLEGADLSFAYLEGADLGFAHLEGADLRGAHLEEADLGVAHLEGIILSGAHLKRVGLGDAHLEGARLYAAHLERARIASAHLEGADLEFAHLEGADLRGAHLEGKSFAADDSDWQRVRRWVPGFPATLSPADLRSVVFDAATTLANAVLVNELHGAVQTADVRWGGANLAVVPDWSPFTERHISLGDERVAWTWRPEPFIESEDQHKQPRQQRAQRRAAHATDQAKARLDAFQAAVRANRQLAIALRAQGMNEQADYFAYRAQVVQRVVLRQQRKWGRAFGSWLLDRVAGYGYQPMRSVFTYLFVVGLFAAAYFFFGGAHGQQLTWNEALVVSLTAFHGRGFFATAFQPGDPQAALAAIEAVIGLLIEITFIATFTQRFFAR